MVSTKYKGLISDAPIFITGIERSGSTIIARALSCCDVFRGHVSNMSENLLLKGAVDVYYREMKADIAGQYPLPDTAHLKIPVNWKELVLDLLVKDGYTKRNPWMYKGFRSGQIWPVWNYAFPNARWVIVRRRTGDIINSCVNTGYMKAFKAKGVLDELSLVDERDGWKWWVHEQEKRFVEMIQAGVNCKVIWPERMLNGDYQQLYETLDWLGLTWNSKIVQEVERSLHKTI